MSFTLQFFQASGRMLRGPLARGVTGGPRASRRSSFFWAGAASLLLGATAQAELEWKERRLALEPPAGASEITGVFEFVNRGKNPVRIDSVRASCGCTAMASENEAVLPGAKGTVRAVFHVGARKGRQTVAVTVQTSEPEPRVYELELDVMIAEFVLVTPGFVFWKLGDEATAKTMQITLGPGFRFVKAECVTNEFLLETTVPAEGAVQLRVVPRDTWAKRSGTIKITVAQGEQPPVDVLAHARVL